MSVATAAEKVLMLEQQVEESSLHVDAFLTSVTAGLAPIVQMLQENISPIGGSPETHLDQKEVLGEGVNFRSVQDLILVQLDTIRHASAYYHDILVYLIGG